MQAYVRALIREMQGVAPRAEGVSFDTVFFGGGTPSLLPTALVDAILSAAKGCFCIDRNAEITLEANPASIDGKGLAALRSLGINRLSVGVQSTVDEELATLGRLHTGREALDFLRLAREVGFDNLNADLMYGIPYQTEESAKRTLDAVLSLAPAHISAYSLMLEEGTPLYAKKDALPIPNEDEEDAIDALVRTTLQGAGYLHYEISNYAKEGYTSRHNLHYWHSDPYLGFGVSAYSFFDGVRYGNTKDMARYLSDPTDVIADREVLNEQSLAYEWIMLRFRLREGIALDEYRVRFGVDLKEQYAEEIERFCAMGLMVAQNGRIFLTEQGFRLSNEILVAFLKE